MKGIIVGVDESSHASAALRWAAEYGGARNWPVTAVLAWDYIQQQHSDPGAGFDPHYGPEEATRVLAELVDRALGERSDITRQVVCDRAASALVEVAGDDAALIVVGARGMNGFKGLLLGSVSRHVLHAARVPVAVIRGEQSHPDGPVVVGIDGSDPARRALEWAVADAERRRRPLVAVHAWLPPYNPMGLWSPVDLRRHESAARSFLDQELSSIDEGRLTMAVERSVPEQRASAALLDAAGEASMLVVGSRGRGQLSKALLGSVSDQVSRHAHCPVVVVP
jgi:nucleotide-binding universal stress UspA family protein